MVTKYTNTLNQHLRLFLLLLLLLFYGSLFACATYFLKLRKQWNDVDNCLMANKNIYLCQFSIRYLVIITYLMSMSLLVCLFCKAKMHDKAAQLLHPPCPFVFRTRTIYFHNFFSFLFIQYCATLVLKNADLVILFIYIFFKINFLYYCVLLLKYGNLPFNLPLYQKRAPKLSLTFTLSFPRLRFFIFSRIVCLFNLSDKAWKATLYQYEHLYKQVDAMRERYLGMQKQVCYSTMHYKQ